MESRDIFIRPRPAARAAQLAASPRRALVERTTSARVARPRAGGADHHRLSSIPAAAPGRRSLTTAPPAIASVSSAPSGPNRRALIHDRPAVALPAVSTEIDLATRKTRKARILSTITFTFHRPAGRRLHWRPRSRPAAAPRRLALRGESARHDRGASHSCTTSVARHLGGKASRRVDARHNRKWLVRPRWTSAPSP
jgi:hypothetical protein